MLYEDSKKQLERDEGVRKDVYYDTMNIPTIGIGFNLKEGLSYEEIDLIFRHRWDGLRKELLGRAPWAAELDEARFGALMNMAYNLGMPKLMMFANMLSALRLKEWAKARDHALNSIWASQVGARAVRIAKQFETGEWQ